MVIPSFTTLPEIYWVGVQLLTKEESTVTDKQAAQEFFIKFRLSITGIQEIL